MLQANKSFFSEIIASISDITFSRDGRYILSRDYMTLKLWDLNKENAPVATYNVHEHLRARVSTTRGAGPRWQSHLLELWRFSLVARCPLRAERDLLSTMMCTDALPPPMPTPAAVRPV